MSWFARFFGGAPRGLPPVLRDARTAYLELPAADLDVPFGARRLVVADVETSGLDPRHDRLIAVGAVAVDHGAIRFGDAFQVVLRQPAPSRHDNILVHGIDGATQLGGRDPAEALLEFLAYAGRAPLAAFHADFDRTVIARAMRSVIGLEPSNTWLDLAFLAPALFPEHAARARNLDEWLGLFGIPNYARHDAVADSLATAQLLQVCLERARSMRLETCNDLVRVEKDQRWLARR
jgi:DNA polymerase III subunit epsilon